MPMRRALVVMLLAMGAMAAPRAQTAAPVVYTVTVPEPEHHWLQVDATFPGLGREPLRARMSRSSPGRYSIHEFAKNVFSLAAFDGRGRALPVVRADADEWDVAGHDGTVRLVYKVFGDYADGTYLAVDTTHAHLNIPATFMWAEGLDDRPIRVVFTPPAGLNWKVATQLYPTNDPWTFTAPNLQYFVDSPTELSNFVESAFTLPNADGMPARFRVVVHSDRSQADVDAYAALVRRLVAEEMAVFGEFPHYEPGQYSFLLDYESWDQWDGMEHRNSTFITDPTASIGTPEGRLSALGTVAHEFFHNWNVERIRPAGIEPFDLTRENVTCCLWLAEGFTEYYGPLLLRRAGFAQPVPTEAAVTVMNSVARTVRSAVEMSEEAPFADASVENDVDDRDRTFLDYYTFGSALALGLDLSLREMPGKSLSLDDYMRKLWLDFGKPADPRPGYVARPYTLKDLRDELAALTGDRAFADTFFDRDVEGHDAMDYAALLAPAGYVLRRATPPRGWIGDTPVAEMSGGLAVGVRAPGATPEPVVFGTPLYAAGVDEGDVIATIDGRTATMAAWSALSQKNPGDRVALVVVRRDGARVTTTATLAADPRFTIVATEDVGGTLAPAQRAFRAAWLGTKVRQ